MVPARVPLLPASISWHCCPKTCEKVTGPAAELGVTGEESIALFGSLAFVMGQSPAAARSLLSLGGQEGTPAQQRGLSPSPEDASFSLFKGESQHP